MKLEYLEVKNFRQYYGAQTLRFANDKQRHVTVIHGSNGAGKTSLFTALNWCLYGVNTDEFGKLVSKRAIKEHAENVETSVKLGFTHANARYIATRKRQGEVLGQSLESRSEDVFELTETGTDGRLKIVYEPDTKIGSILPREVREYFFFDGEKIDNFARPKHEHEVKNAVRLVLKIEAIERAQAHLKTVSRGYRSELRKHSEASRLTELLARRDDKEKERDNLVAEQAALREEMNLAKNHKNDVDAKLSQNESSRLLSEKRERINEEVRQLKHDENQLWLAIREVTNRSFFTLAKPAVTRAQMILEEKRQKGDMQSGIRETFLNDLLHAMKCICGRSIQDGSEEHRNILKRLNQSMSSPVENAVHDVTVRLNKLSTDFENIPMELSDLWDKRQSLNSEIESRRGALKEISIELVGYDEQEIPRLEMARRQLKNDIDSLGVKIAQLTGGLDILKKDIVKLDEQIKREQVAEERANHLQRCLNLATAANVAADQISERFAHDMRQTIEDEAQKIFKQLIWKETHFPKIRLTDSYELDVYDRYGTKARPEMSAGERQVLSLAFIAGMANVAREEEAIPLVMDTPFGRLSSVHREKIATRIPTITDQLILFVTDEELHGKARDILEPRIGMEYQLEFDPVTSSTEIRRLQLGEDNGTR